MAIDKIGLSAYQNAMQISEKLNKADNPTRGKESNAAADFSDMITDSLSNVNEMQSEKSNMIKAFASGEETNVHELMITLQKAGLAMSMTTAVRGKVMEAYKEILRMPF